MSYYEIVLGSDMGFEDIAAFPYYVNLMVLIKTLLHVV